MAPPRTLLGLLVAVCTALAPIATARSDPRPPLGGYEQEALTLALTERRLEIDPAPEGKRVGFIFVFSEEVFGERDGLLQDLNLLHRTTREHVIEREVLLRPGDPWNPTIAEETRRNLLGSQYVSLAVVVPVRAARPGIVDILVVTRDVWSLRLNTNFEYQGNRFSLVQLQPSENNLFGLNKQLVLVFDMNLGRTSIGPSYEDNNVKGTRWQFGAGFRALMSRETGELEGSSSSVGVSYPLWSYRRKWAVGFSVSHLVAVARRFSGSDPCTFSGVANECDPDPGSGVPVRYRSRSVGTGASVTRQVGERVINRFSLSYGFSTAEREIFEGDFAAFPQLRQPFIDALPRAERVSALSLSYSMFIPDFVTFRDIVTFDFPEDVALGPSLSLSAGWAMPALGSERQFWTLSGSVGFAFELPGKGLARVGGGASTRVQDGALIDNNLSVTASLDTPKIAGLARLVTVVHAQRLIDNRAIRGLGLGGDAYLRGYPIGAFVGQALVRTNVELRTVGIPVWFSRMGLVAFWEAGHAASDFDALVLHHDFGLGARIVIPQLQRAVIRFDWAVANRDIVTTGGGVFHTAGLPGRFSAGFAQAF